MLQLKKRTVVNTYYFSSCKNRCYNCYMLTYIVQHENIDLIHTWSSMMQKKLWELEKCQHMIITTSQGGHFLDFCGFSWRYAGPQSNLHSRMEISSMALPTPKSPMLLHFQILCIDQLKKNSYFDRKLTKSESEATI